jgi:hypothetical protein
MSKRISDNQAGGEHVLEQLSAYIDNALDAGERERVRAHIETCDGCRAEHQELRATKQMLLSMPVARPPRAFTLTQEMVAAKPSLWQRLRVPRWYPRLATGSVVAFALLVMLLLGNLASTQYYAVPMMSAPAEESTAMEAGTSDASNMAFAAASPTPEAFTHVGDVAEPTAMPAAGGAMQGVEPTGVAKAVSEVPATGGPVAANPAQAPVAAVPTSAYDSGAAPQATAAIAQGDGAERSAEERDSSQPAPPAEQPLPYSPPPANDVSWAFILQVSLAVLGVALGVGAIIARMRGV